MILSKNNILVKIKNSKAFQYAILNPVSGSFDLMTEDEHLQYTKIAAGESPESDFSSYLLERGYGYESSEDHEKAVNKAYAEFKKEIGESQVQLMLVPTYSCNLACTYCFQHGIEGRPTLISKETVDSFFEYAKNTFSGGSQKPFITLFGGEPLVNSKNQREIIEYIIARCVAEDYELSVVTNGYDLAEYVELLQKVKIKEIQVTLDGSQKVHDSRRATANKKGTFLRIVEGMELAIEAGMPINLRSVVDIENLADLVNLAEFLKSKGWLDLPPELFKTQIGRNYELFDCYAKPQHLLSQVELWAEFSRLSKEYPVLTQFHRPDFKGIRHLVDTGEMYMASFDTCPACKTEWVFDLYGHIYGCTASCGREEFLLGTFWPKVELNQPAIDTWKTRDVKSIAKCLDCKYDVVCGGGCGVVAANKNNGQVLSPDCRPIQELMDLGINHYVNDIDAMAGEDVSFKKTEGCMICGHELIYSKDLLSKENCYICNQSFETYIKCPQGHYICDSCHSLDILAKVEQLLISSREKNPVVLAQKIFELQGLNMHGPEYHSIVPGVLVTAYQNFKGQREVSKIKEALKRGKDVKGGNCGFFGNCGSGVGAGIAVSVLEGATPMSKIQRGSANRVTGHALLAISHHGGPRCCKREAITAIESFIRTTDYFSGLEKAAYTCKQFKKNKDCILSHCPYFPKKRVKVPVYKKSKG